MDDLKLVLDVNDHGELVMPFSRRVLNLPRIEDCLQLRDLIVQQGNNLVWWYTKKFENIRFETTVRELNVVYDQNMNVRVQQRTTDKDIVSIDNDNKTTENEEEEDDDDIIWIEPDGNSNITNAKK